MRLRFQAVVALLAAALMAATLVALPAILLCSLTGCGGRAPATAVEKKQTENVADAAAGMAALRAMMPPDVRRVVGPTIAMQIDDVIIGASAFAQASAGDLALPASAWTPEKIAANPAAYRIAGQGALRTAQGTQAWFWLKVIGGGLAGLVAPLAAAVLSKELPIAGPIVAKLFEGLWRIGTPAATKEEDEARTILAGHASSVLEVAAAALPPGEAQRAVARLPPEVIEAAQRIGITLPSGGTALADALAGAAVRSASFHVPMPAGPTTT